MKSITHQEYAPYYSTYVAHFSNEDIVSSMSQQMLDMDVLMLSKDPSIKDFSYAAGKWSVAELLLHIIDTERVFAYRALSIARGDQTALPGFDQDIYVAHSRAAHRSYKSLLDEFSNVRKATISLFESFDQDSLLILGHANGQSVSVRALGYIILGHCKHHMQILTEKYFV